MKCAYGEDIIRKAKKFPTWLEGTGTAVTIIIKNDKRPGLLSFYFKKYCHLSKR